MREQSLSEPRISVIMGVYNCAPTLRDALHCLEIQTVQDWELVICDDGSTDESYSILEAFRRCRPDQVHLLQNEENKGLNYTLNRCLSASRGRFIARMDGDDLCVEDRFEKELIAFQDEPELSIVSSDMTFFDNVGVWGQISHPTYPTNTDFLHGSPFCHAPCMIRREAIEAVGGYSEDPKLLRVEDYHLWIKMYKMGLRGKNIHEPLYSMRDDRAAYDRRTFRSRLNEAYVRFLAVKELELPAYGYLTVLRPIVLGMLPKMIYDYLHRRSLRIDGKDQ